MSRAKKTAKTHKPWLAFLLIGFGSLTLLAGLTLGILTYAPVIWVEAQYQLRPIVSQKGRSEAPKPSPTPLDRQFGILIPKLGINSRVVPDVDPYDSRIYQQALTRGVAHAKGTSVPGAGGTIFIFSHSSVNFFEATRYNSIFYLLSKLVKGDEIQIFYTHRLYTYHVSDIQIIKPNDVSFLETRKDKERLILMTCWPPGTTLQRLIIIAN